MVVVVDPSEAAALERDLLAAGETVWTLGRIESGARGVEWTRP
jgi:phosphoribosylaminoimidazole (AIR) synthetase